MIIPTGKLKFGEHSIEILIETPLNTKHIATTHAKGVADDRSNHPLSLVTLVDGKGLDEFIKTNNITNISSYNRLEEYSTLDAYARLIVEAVAVGANAAEIIQFQNTLIDGKLIDETMIIARLYKLPNRE